MTAPRDEDLVDHVAEQLTINEHLRVASAHVKPLRVAQIDRIRRNRIEGGGGLQVPDRVESAFDRAIPGPAGDLAVRMFVAPNSQGLVVHLHGGGWVFGSVWEQDRLLDQLSQSAEVTVASVGYRLAPEHPFPAGVDDVVAAIEWALDIGRSESGVEHVVIAADSAGAHLAACALVRLRDSGRDVATEIAGVSLSYGIYSLGFTPSQQHWGTETLVLSTERLAWFSDQFAPGTSPDARRRAELSPLFADHRNLPPALFVVGTQDPLLDDSLLMAASWRAAGSDAQITVYPAAPHGFNSWSSGMAHAANDRIASFIRQRVSLRDGNERGGRSRLV